MRKRRRAPTVPDMEVVRIVDGDERSLSSRVARALAALGPECTVLRFTYWYTGRPPVYEAIVRC